MGEKRTHKQLYIKNVRITELLTTTSDPVRLTAAAHANQFRNDPSSSGFLSNLLPFHRLARESKIQG